MDDLKVVIIGAGFVGGTLYKAISQIKGYEVKIYDKHKESCKLFKEASNVNWADLAHDMNAEIYFLCLPTPMIADSGGACDISLVKHWVKNLAEKARSLPEVVLKSTVPPNTGEYLNNSFGGGIHFNPEFLTEKNAYEDFVSLPYQIIGSSTGAHAPKTKKLFEDAYSQGILACKDIIETNITVAELVKYTRNCYLATRISYFNEIYQMCERVKAPYDEVKNLAGLDLRVGNHYNDIDPEEPEFSGHCLPKDLNALIYKMNHLGLKPTLLEGVWQKNLEVAKKKTWEAMEGRAISHSATAGFKQMSERIKNANAKKQQKTNEG